MRFWADGNKKSSTLARYSTGLSQSFPDYRGLPHDEKIIASAALQSVKHSDSIAPNNAIVKNAISKIKQMLEDIEGGEADKDGKPIVNYYFAGKVNIGDVEKIVFVRTRKSDGRANRFYVHEVFTEDEIAKLGSQQTDAALANTSRKYRNASEFYCNIIAKVLNYKLPGEKKTKK